jgi:hypothetical protein
MGSIVSATRCFFSYRDESFRVRRTKCLGKLRSNGILKDSLVDRSTERIKSGVRRKEFLK